MLKRLGYVVLIAAIGCVAIAWSKANAVPQAGVIRSITPSISVPSTAIQPCLKPIDRATIA